jgi:hypothetical protein
MPDIITSVEQKWFSLLSEINLFKNRVEVYAYKASPLACRAKRYC